MDQMDGDGAGVGSPGSPPPEAPRPSVYDEGHEMMLACVLLYGVVDLRTLGRRGAGGGVAGGLAGSEEVLEAPVSDADAVRLLSEHQCLVEERVGEESTELYLDAFRAALLGEEEGEEEEGGDGGGEDEAGDGRYRRFGDASGGRGAGGVEMRLGDDGRTAGEVGYDFVRVGDDRSRSELVHGITVHHPRRRITVVFRGCSTRKDWAISSQVFLTDVASPVSSFVTATTNNSSNDHRHQRDGESRGDCYHRHRNETISIHRGFYKYLFLEGGSGGGGRSKFDAIVDDVLRLQEQHPGYSVYVTGHSLGGALATIFAFHYAALLESRHEERRRRGGAGTASPPGAVTCVPVASPMVGNLSFEDAFRGLEGRGRIRCLRITNHFDVFTQLPDHYGLMMYAFAYHFWSFLYYVAGSWMFFLCCQKRVYRHVGMDLHLYSSAARLGKGGGGDGDEPRRWFCCWSPRGKTGYKIKHPRGSSRWYCSRVFHDWRKHVKQAVQRLLTVPFVCFCDFCCCKVNFKRNHGMKEHLRRFEALRDALGDVYLDDLYEERRFPPAAGGTSCCGGVPEPAAAAVGTEDTSYSCMESQPRP